VLGYGFGAAEDKLVWTFGERPTGFESVSSIENSFVAVTAWGKFGGMYRRSPVFKVWGLPARENSHSPERI
jgi:hypothetical protein